MTPTSAFWKWGLIGLVAATVLVVAQSRELGGLEGLLQVGETSALRPVIEEKLGQVPLVEGPGHDGQIYYAIATDLSGEVAPELFDHAAYRYRRIAFPLLGSAFGLLDGHEALYGMIVVVVVSTAVAAGSLAALVVAQGRSDWWALSVVLNPGVWLSVQLLTADVLAIAAMIFGLLALFHRSKWQHAGFIASVLTKDVFLATPVGLAFGRDRRRWLIALAPAVALFALMVGLSATVGDGFTPRGNIDWPGVGIMKASSNWSSFDTQEWFYLGFALASMAAGLIVGLSRPTWLRWSILFWSVLALVSSNWVWDFGNNAARAFAPILILLVLAAGQDSAKDNAGPSETFLSGAV